ncbi:acyl CoA:acetate/3-ketoacid CoA transferase [Companilactobacillus mishanensis]|uniref:3-oxoacid CoA-transferase n=1 Tax=Companilactobacillus mishanensis TaxID=2486008 RepID=A0A5P0ZFD1_9LACO|nr:CoA-transferase [Companilactobacillus mishanensis]MQS44136.1 3-oxoacid CoA-transferase [Companilactobacillus mishanensis]MQS51754.1 3-oxoacid CoA-transferase [Companilactobacillus mishanensis]MQS88435.1 3-oxoacid CoA-transferase [Companilactobacillus mishanensis]
MTVQFINSEKAAELIPDDATIALEGFLGSDVAEEILENMRKRFDNEGHPKNLEVWHASGIGDGKDRGTNNFAAKGMLRRLVGGHWALAPKLEPLVADNEFEAYNFPQGVMSQIFRDSSAHKPIQISKVGLGTFVDPDVEGGKLNDAAKKDDLVSKMKIHGEDYLAYEVPKPNVAILRGTYADEDGNITFDDEPLILESTSIAMAAHNNGGKVFVQVKRVLKKGSMKPKDIRIPGLLVDYVVETSDESMTRQSTDTQFNPDYVNQAVVKPAGAIDVPLDAKKVIARRAAMFKNDDDNIVNYGIGKYPETVSLVLKEEGSAENITTTVEPGTFGGVPMGGGDFGCAIGPEATIDQPYMFDFYDGGGIDIAFLGLAELDKKGNINVSKFGPKIAGTGGFVNITQNTPTVVYTGTFMAAGLKEEVKDGKLNILKEGKFNKLVDAVEQITFSGPVAHQNKQNVYYVTERAVFKLVDGGIELTEIAPGIDLQKDVLDHMDFKPIISDDLRYMDPRIFEEPLMGDTNNKPGESVNVNA